MRVGRSCTYNNISTRGPTKPHGLRTESRTYSTSSVFSRNVIRSTRNTRSTFELTRSTRKFATEAKTQNAQTQNRNESDVDELLSILKDMTADPTPAPSKKPWQAAPHTETYGAHRRPTTRFSMSDIEEAKGAKKKSKGRMKSSDPYTSDDFNDFEKQEDETEASPEPRAPGDKLVFKQPAKNTREDFSKIPSFMLDLWVNWKPPKKPLPKLNRFRKELVREFMEKEYAKTGEVYRAAPQPQTPNKAIYADEKMPERKVLNTLPEEQRQLHKEGNYVLKLSALIDPASTDPNVAMKLKVEGSSEYFEDREGHIIPRNLPQKARPPKRIPCFFCWKKRWGEELVWDPMNVPLWVRFMSPAGTILPRTMTGNCQKHQKLVSKTIKKAKHLGQFSYKKSHYKINSPFALPRYVNEELGYDEEELENMVMEQLEKEEKRAKGEKEETEAEAEEKVEEEVAEEEEEEEPAEKEEEALAAAEEEGSWVNVIKDEEGKEWVKVGEENGKDKLVPLSEFEAEQVEVQAASETEKNINKQLEGLSAKELGLLEKMLSASKKGKGARDFSGLDELDVKFLKLLEEEEEHVDVDRTIKNLEKAGQRMSS